jgi:hypothetical protein
MLSTHIDALAGLAGRDREIDPVSLADFILNNVCTYPRTLYRDIRQCPPATVHRFRPTGGDVEDRPGENYWLPRENNPFADIQEAAGELYRGARDYIRRAAAGMENVAHFLSGGEDSRVIAALLPGRLGKDSFVFLDGPNREEKAARRVARAYDSRLRVVYRKKSHYLDILPAAAALVGAGHQYIHAHSLGLAEECGLDRYPAVFGGWLADSLLKAGSSRQTGLRQVFPFVPQVGIPGETRSRPLVHPLVRPEILEAIDGRRREHLERVQGFRDGTAHEWFELWPATMRSGIGYFFSNRRLFRTYEPFMSNQAVRLAAAAPAAWKLNRRLFHRAFRGCLKPSRRILHANGYLPALPWWPNLPIHCALWVSRQIGRRLGLIRGYQGPWGDWNGLIGGGRWRECVENYAEGFEEMRKIWVSGPLEDLMDGGLLSPKQRINLLQGLHLLAGSAARSRGGDPAGEAAEP